MSWLSKLLEDAGKKPAALARHLGVKPPRVSEMIKGTRRMQPREIPLAAKFFGIAVERVAALAAGEADPGESFILPIQTEARPAPDAPLPPMRTEMPKDVPVYGTVVGGSGQGSLFDFELNGTVVDYVRRPPRIAGRADVFAAYVAGGSMAPWREPGQLIYAESVKSPKPLDYVLVELKPRDGGGVRPALVKRLVAITPTKLRLRQFDPPKDFDVDLKAVLRVCRIMDWDELMGV